MDKPKMSQIKVREDRPTGIASSAHGANVNALAFNLDLIGSKDPKLAAQVLKDYKEAHAISPNDPPHPDEDFSLALEDFPEPTDED
jgi:hypothetical protein